MMHGREKSGSAIVAGKPTNNAVLTAAEPVERRARAKGNASQQSTDRAQSRASVSQALARIRQAARQRKKEKFTALLHHISVDLLEEAFFDLKEDAAAGVDGLKLGGLRAKSAGPVPLNIVSATAAHPPDPEMAEGGCTIPDAFLRRPDEVIE